MSTDYRTPETERTATDAYCTVCPLSVLSNWESQIDEHAAPGQLKYIVFYGDGREVSQAKLEKADVVITTYQVVTSEQSTRPSKAKKAKTGQSTGRLIDTKWKRIVLDEGHTIRNAATGMARWAAFQNVLTEKPRLTRLHGRRRQGLHCSRSAPTMGRLWHSYRQRSQGSRLSPVLPEGLQASRRSH